MAHEPQALAGARAGPLSWYSLKSADFVAMLATAPLATSRHFVLQHLAASPASAKLVARRAVVPNLSTADAPTRADSVDNISAPSAWWLGVVVPKRHAKRAVTRNLLKRQVRAVVDRHRPRMPPGQWLVRLRAPFDARLFVSAASAALRETARVELEEMFARGVPA